MNKVLLELPVPLAPEVPLALLVLLEKMDSMVFLAPSVPLVPVVVLEMLVLLVPLDLLDPLVLLVPPVVDSTSASCPSHPRRRLTTLAAITELMMLTCVTVTLKLTPPSRA